MKPDELRQLQMCELGILKEIKRVCEKHNITYYLSSGTLLGAVRHKGFIPWDDDVDIEMPYADYLKFLSVAQDELGSGYFVQNTDTDDGVYTAFTKVRKNGTLMMSPWEQEDVGHHGVWIDVFPMTTISGERDEKLKRFFITVSNYLLMPEKTFHHSETWYKSRSSNIQFGAIKLIRKMPLGVRSCLREMLLKYVFQDHSGSPKKSVFVWGNLSKPKRLELYEGETVKLPFEDDMFPVPPLYHEYLTVAYGDYMTPPPQNQRDGGHGDIIVKLNNV